MRPCRPCDRQGNMVSNTHIIPSPSAACYAVSFLLASFVPNNEAFVFSTLVGRPALARSVPCSATKSAPSHKCGVQGTGNVAGCTSCRPSSHRSGFSYHHDHHEHGQYMGTVRGRSRRWRGSRGTRCRASETDLDMGGLMEDGGEQSMDGSGSGSGGGGGEGGGSNAAGSDTGSETEGRASWEDDMTEADDAQELTKQFYSAVASRWNTTVEGAMEVEKELRFDRSIYDELRARRDFGFEQDLELELKKRNLTQDAEETKEILQGLDALPGVSASTTVLPSQDLTPRDVISSVMEALKNNNKPYINHGVEVFVRFLSPTSAMHGVSLEGVARYLAENRNRALMKWDALAYPRPLALSGMKKNKAFQPIKLKDSVTGRWHPVSVYLTLNPRTKFWLIESMIMKGDLDL